MPHTAGPWKAGTGVASTIISGPDGRIIGSATVNRTVCSYSESVANARLISAAPLLLKACKPFLETTCNCEDGYTCEMCELRAVIAAAEGEEAKS